ncbi:prepilin-type N-terminal cleavage/methylation domain-containing protein [Mitsuaria sp. CC2]|uniref:pilus assembly FimT family protein n=1 Tax=Mitsuaria sp. CC2 TaxID=3029186 RepID=UPI003B8E3539
MDLRHALDHAQGGHVLTRSRGMTLVELMVVVSIIALMTALAVPGIRSWAVNAQIRSNASALQSNLRQAQAEAVRSFRQVVFFRTNDTTCTGRETAAAAGTRWVIKVLPLVAGGAVSASQCGSVLDNAAGLAVNGPTAVCFGANGRPLSLTATQTAVGTACTTGTNGRIIYGIEPTGTTANLKQLQVWLTLGGTVRSCEKTRMVSDTVPDGCPAINQAPTT